MLRRALAITLLAAPAAMFTLTQGCSTEPLPADLCSWLKDANSCYTRFANDVFDHCGMRPQEGSDPLVSASGYFPTRDDLSLCIINEGGQVLFDPALEPSMFPVETVAVTLMDKKALECGTVAIGAGNYNFSITVNPVSVADAGDHITNEDGTPLSDDITGGTFAMTRAEGRDRVDVSCPGGVESHNFNLIQLTKCDGNPGKEDDLSKIMPQAILESSPGAPPTGDEAGIPGFVRLRVYFPPVFGDDGNLPDNPTNRVVEYFNCLIPAPPAPCANGVRDGSETDVDCGGVCPVKCAEGQNCNVNSDCSSMTCTFVEGIQVCG